MKSINIRIIIFILLFIIIFLVQPKARACPDEGTIGCTTHYITGPSLFLNLIIIAGLSYLISLPISRILESRAGRR